MSVRLLCFFTLVGCMLNPMAASAQSVRRGSLTGWGLSRRRYERAAEEQGRRDWVRLREGQPGTHVVVTFDARNADVTLWTNRSFGLNQLLAEAKRIAAALSLPQTDFITVQGRTTVIVDMEFNDYLQRQRWRTDFELDWHALATALQHSTLRRPVVMAVDPEDATRVTVRVGDASRDLEKIWFVLPQEVQPGTRLHYQAVVTWQGLPIVALILFGLVMALIMPWRMAKWKAARAQQEELPLDPAEVQRKYDKVPPIWMMVAGFTLVPLVFLLLARPGQMATAIQLLCPCPVEWMPFVLVGLAGGSWGLCWLVTRLRASRGQVAPAPVQERDPDLPPAWTSYAFFLPLLIPMLLMPLILIIPVYTPTAALWQKYIGLPLLGLSAISILFVQYLAFRATRTVLTEGPWHDMVRELAAQAGVKVKRVVLVKSPVLNAYASIFGTVGLTTALVRKLEAEEIKAVVAHELGHIKSGHPRRTLMVTLLTFTAIWGLWWGAQWFLEQRLPSPTARMLNNPVLFIVLANLLVLLLTGRGRRRREEEADRFAVEWTGDPKLVIRSLTRLHTLNASPHRLKPSDEAISTHPSLAHRIEAIRRRGRGVGVP